MTASLFSDFPPIAVHTGVICLACQLVLHLLFAFVLPNGPWKALPSLTAHQIICFPLMVYMTFEGFVVWFTQQDHLFEGGMDTRIFSVSPRGADLAAMVWGMMVLWDIPVSICTKSLHDPLMLGHHIGMSFVSGIAAGIFSEEPVGSYYAPFFFGVIELSSIFLCLVDLFHPKNAAWNEWLKNNKTGMGHFLLTLNELSRVLFAISYLALRTVTFPYVMFSTCLMDFWEAAMLPDEERRGASSWSLVGVCVLAFGFTFLQINWGLLVGRQVGKAVGLLPDKDIKGSKVE